MNRRFYLLLCCVMPWFLPTSCSKSPGRPNIVFILADDMGHSDLGCYGAEFLKTPNVDALAAGGLRFTNFYNTGRCWPTRTGATRARCPISLLIPGG